jgi:hypothetical protein
MPVTRSAGGLIDDSWCFDTYGKRLAELPPICSEADILRPELLLTKTGRVTVYYCPSDSVNPPAKIVIVGITPGRHQAFLACREAQQAPVEGLNPNGVLRRARAVAAFAGSMRTNLVNMLDGIGIHEALGIASTQELFDQRADLLHATSAVLYPVFLDGRNYGGSPRPLKFPILKAFVDQVLIGELAMVQDAFVIPLGKAVSALLRVEVDRGALPAERCLLDFPHPSGANGHRIPQYKAHRRSMAKQVTNWAASNHWDTKPPTRLPGPESDRQKRSSVRTSMRSR